MIIPLSNLKELYPNENEQSLIDKILAIESAIRGYTNNNFQDTRVRFTVDIKNNKCSPSSNYIKAGDTITISQSINEGFYNVECVTDEHIAISEELIDSPVNLLTKVKYPHDVISVAMDLLKWTIEYSNKQAMGITEESISRYTVKYANTNSEETNVNGFPISIMNRLKPYMKAKF